MSDIYEQHEKAFARVSAFVILKDGARVATVAIKFPADGAGRLYAYCHVIGLEMQRGSATGYGYDKRSPAVREAFTKARAKPDGRDAGWHSLMSGRVAEFNAALAVSDGEYWDRLLERAGFIVLQAV